MSEFELLPALPAPEGITGERMEILEKLARIGLRVLSEQMESGDIHRKHMHDAAIFFDLIGKYERLTGEPLSGA